MTQEDMFIESSQFLQQEADKLINSKNKAKTKKQKDRFKSELKSLRSRIQREIAMLDRYIEEVRGGNP